MTTCGELARFLMAYLDRELPEEQRVAFEQHLKACPPCVIYLKTYEATIRLCKKSCAEDARLPGAVPEALVQAILKARRATK